MNRTPSRENRPLLARAARSGRGGRRARLLEHQPSGVRARQREPLRRPRVLHREAEVFVEGEAALQVGADELRDDHPRKRSSRRRNARALLEEEAVRRLRVHDEPRARDSAGEVARVRDGQQLSRPPPATRTGRRSRAIRFPSGSLPRNHVPDATSCASIVGRGPTGAAPAAARGSRRTRCGPRRPPEGRACRARRRPTPRDWIASIPRPSGAWPCRRPAPTPRARAAAPAADAGPRATGRSSRPSTTPKTSGRLRAAARGSAPRRRRPSAAS